VEGARSGRAAVAGAAAGPWPSLLRNGLCPWVTYQVLTPQAVRAALESTMPAGAAPAGEVAYAPRLREVLDRATDAAGAGPVGTEHLLHGLAAVEDGMAARGLLQAGVDPARLRERVGGGSAAPGPGGGQGSRPATQDGAGEPTPGRPDA
jgi:hypothetical protein